MSSTQGVHHQQVNSGDPGCCGVPAKAPCVVSAARGFCIFGLTVHVLALLAGIWIIWQWVASVIAFVACGVLLSCYNKGAYVAATILSIVGLSFDIVSLVIWIGLISFFSIRITIGGVPVEREYENSYAGTYAVPGFVLENWERIVWFGLPCALSTLSLLFVVIFGLSSLCCWKDATIGAAVSAPVVQVPAPSHSVHSTHDRQRNVELGEMPPPLPYGKC